MDISREKINKLFNKILSEKLPHYDVQTIKNTTRFFFRYPSHEGLPYVLEYNSATGEISLYRLSELKGFGAALTIFLSTVASQFRVEFSPRTINDMDEKTALAIIEWLADYEPAKQ